MSALVIVGAGPAGLALAASARELDLSVTLLDPAPEARWIPTYAGWVDELDAPLDAVWPTVEVRIDEGEVLTLRRPYGRVDGPALQDRLRARVAGARIVARRAVRVAPDG